MKNTSAAFRNELAQETGNICICVRIVRKDGRIYGFTTWDRPFTYTFITNPDSVGAVNYISQNAFLPSDMVSSSDLGVDNLEIAGIVSWEGLIDRELSAGVFEGAEVTFFRVNPENLSIGEMIDKRGYIGEITLIDDRYVCEILTSTSFLRRNVGHVFSPTCRVKDFCDAQCKLNINNFTHAGTISWHSDPRVLNVIFQPNVAITVPILRFVHGKLRVNFGTYSLTREVKRVSVFSANELQITLRESFGIEVDFNTAFLIQGCNRHFETCVSLNNSVNFRGEPHLPGVDDVFKSGKKTITA